MHYGVICLGSLFSADLTFVSNISQLRPDDSESKLVCIIKAAETIPVEDSLRR